MQKLEATTKAKADAAAKKKEKMQWEQQVWTVYLRERSDAMAKENKERLTE